MDIVKIILNILFYSIIIIILFTVFGFVLDKYRTNIIKKTKIIESENLSKDKIMITDIKLKRALLINLKNVLIYLENLYGSASWNNKRFLYSIISDLEKLKLRLKGNELTNLDIEKLYKIITIIKINKKISNIAENIIFEWEKNYKK